MTPLAADPQESTAARRDFRFDGVVVDPARFRLLVDGSERAVQPLALRLLLILCEAQGRVVTRREVFDRLWPRQEVGDESLTQQTARLREALGPYAKRVVTVRRVGLRLDAPIARGDAVDATERSDPPAPPQPPLEPEPTAEPEQSKVAPKAGHEAPVQATRWRRPMALLALAVLLVSIALWPRPDAPILGSQGLTETDLAAEKPSTAAALRRAWALDARGRRDEALVLLEVTLDADPQAALPAAYLALINQARGERDNAVRWKRLALQRLQDRPAERIRLLLHPIDHLRTPADSKTLASLSLIATTADGDLAPSLSRAHAHLGRAERDLARAQLEALRWADIDPINIPVVLGDLAALGASAPAQALFQRHLAELDASIAAETRARFAATRGDNLAASAEMATALAAFPKDRAWARQTLLALHYALEAGQIARAEELIRDLQRNPRRTDHPKLAFDVALLQAGLPTLTDAAASTVLAEAMTLAQQMDFEPDCWEIALLAALRHASSLPIHCKATPAELATVPGMAALLRAAEAYRAGQHASAISALQEATDNDIDRGLYAAHANALRQRLGLATLSTPSFDPPYPTWSRHSARRLGSRP